MSYADTYIQHKQFSVIKGRKPCFWSIFSHCHSPWEKEKKIRKSSINLEGDSAGCELLSYPLVEADSPFLQSLFHFDISLM